MYTMAGSEETAKPSFNVDLTNYRETNDGPSLYSFALEKFFVKRNKQVTLSFKIKLPQGERPADFFLRSWISFDQDKEELVEACAKHKFVNEKTNESGYSGILVCDHTSTTYIHRRNENSIAINLSAIQNLAEGFDVDFKLTCKCTCAGIDEKKLLWAFLLDDVRAAAGETASLPRHLFKVKICKNPGAHKAIEEKAVLNVGNEKLEKTDAGSTSVNMEQRMLARESTLITNVSEYDIRLYQRIPSPEESSSTSEIAEQSCAGEPREQGSSASGSKKRRESDATGLFHGDTSEGENAKKQKFDQTEMINEDSPETYSYDASCSEN